MTPELPIPSHFEPARVGEVWRVDYATRAADAERWAEHHRIARADEDVHRRCLMLVDCQNTFCVPGHELFVAGRSGTGAVDDNVRLCEFLYRNLPSVTEIVATMDTHRVFQIFHPVFWVDVDGRHPEGAQTIIEVDDVERGTWRVNPAVARTLGVDGAWLRRYALHYVRRLAEGRLPLMVWPYHAMLGGIGHALVSAVEEAAFFHAVARGAAPRIETKGDLPLTEHYSVLSPEVLEGPDGAPIGRGNEELVDHLLAFDAIIIAGQAKSHCVAWSVHDLLTEIQARDPGLAGKVYLMEDCMSPVVVPGGVDFTEATDEVFGRFYDAGMHRVRSTDPIASWPGELT